MLGYISSTRKKSCRQCVKAKRRCDLGFPSCKRCFTKNLDCAYPNASVREAEVVIRQTTPDLGPVVQSDAPGPAEQPRASPSIDPTLLTQSDSSSGSSPERPEGLSERLSRVPQSGIPKSLAPTILVPSYLNDSQVLFSLEQLKNFVSTLAHTGRNVIVHDKLFTNNQPEAYLDSCSLSALYLAKTKRNITILTKSIDNKIAALISSSQCWSLPDHLAAVQALITYQIMRLFDPELAQQANAQRQMRLLEVWTAHLWKRSFNETTSFDSSFNTWVFYESLRRTVLISVFLRGAWSAVTMGGLCDQVPVLARLPISRNDRMWEIDENEFQRQGLVEHGPDDLISYGDFSLEWDAVNDDPRGLTELQKLLLVPCRAQDDPRLLV